MPEPGRILVQDGNCGGEHRRHGKVTESDDGDVRPVPPGAGRDERHGAEDGRGKTAVGGLAAASRLTSSAAGFSGRLCGYADQVGTGVQAVLGQGERVALSRRWVVVTEVVTPK